jgi:HD superfamily phosphohydrolase YqeK
MPGSGIHDYLPQLERNEMEAWALATEYHHRLVTNTTNLIGGLHDYIGSLTNKQVIEYITKKVNEHPELNNDNQMKTLVNKLGYLKVDETRNKNFGGIHDVLPKLSRKDLERWALKCEQYRFRDSGMVLGGLHDYIFKMTRKEITDYILKEVNAFPEINSINFFNDVFKANPKRLGGLHDYLFKLNRTELEDWAFRVEMFHFKKLNIKGPILGQLSSYIFRLSNQEIIRYILTKVKEHPELDSVEFMKSLPSKTAQIIKVVDLIYSVSREELSNWAIMAEKHDRKAKGQEHMMGGLHDYIATLTNEKIIEYIMKKIGEYPELNDVAYFRNNVPRVSGLILGGGLHDIIPTLSREEMENWALTIENYHRMVNNQTDFDGGLHDYIRMLNKTEIVDYISAELREHPEINNKKVFNQLLKNFGKAIPKTLKFLGFSGKETIDLEKYVLGLDRDTIMKYALALEKYERDITGIHPYGGLHDYINSLSDNQIRAYILEKTKRFPEINTPDKLDEVSLLK